MGAPTKKGIDWFPLDTALDDKIELLEAEFGVAGFAIAVKLLQKAYRIEGYFCRWTDREKLLFSKKESVTKKLAEQVVAKAIEYELFDASIFESFNVLTSNGIQKRYLVATAERKQVEIVGEYLLAEIPPGNRVKITSLNGDACG